MLLKISDLQLNTGQIEGVPTNPRTITEKDFEELKDSLTRNPDNIKKFPLVIAEHKKQLVVISGNQRLRAMQALGWKELDHVGEIYPEGTDPETLREAVIIANTHKGEWDWDALANDGWEQESLEDWGIDTTQEWATEKDIPEKIDEIPTPPKIPVSKLGDLWLLGDHRVLCGDATDTKTFEQLMDGQTADMVFTDPPYNVDYEGGTGLKIMNDKMGDNQFYLFLLESFSRLAEVMRNGAPIYITHADSEGKNFRAAMEDSGLLMKQCIIWVKNSMVLGRQDYQWQHEPILYGWKPGAAHKWYGNFDKKTVIDDQLDTKKLTKAQLQEIVEGFMQDTTVVRENKPLRSESHPTMKPVALIAKFLWNSSIPEDIVVDSFLGSGSTLIAAHQLERKCYGIELDPTYVDVSCKRYQTLTGELPILQSTGKAHDFSS